MKWIKNLGMFLLGVWTGSVFGGSVTAIFINIPGKPSSVCTMIEGFPWRKGGKDRWPWVWPSSARLWAIWWEPFF